MMFRRLIGDDRGANAIEYSLLAGIVALGIVGSLVTTRTSLSGVFNGLSGQIGTATGTSAVAPPPAAPAYAGKTQTNRVVSTDYAGRSVYTYTYSDGSTATYTAALASNPTSYPASLRLNYADKSISTYYAPAYDKSGNQVGTPSYFMTTTYADGYAKTATSYNPDASGQTASGTQYTYEDRYNGNVTSTATVTTPVSTFDPLVKQFGVYSANP